MEKPCSLAPKSQPSQLVALCWGPAAGHDQTTLPDTPRSSARISIQRFARLERLTVSLPDIDVTAQDLRRLQEVDLSQSIG